MGYDAALSRNVKAEVTGNTLALTGDINFTSKDEGFSSVASDRTGYYYPVTIKANQDSTVTFSQSPTKTQTINGTTKTYTVDYTGLNFR